MTDDSKKDAGPDALQKLAADYVDLWEQQFKALANDETVAQSMAQAMQLMNAGAANMAAMMQQAATAAEGTKNGQHDAAAKGADSDTARADSGDGTASAGSAHRGPDPDLRSILGRLAELEDRLDRLESLVAPEGKRPARSARKS